MSLPRYERYKDSGVEWLGEVPEHWQVRRLDHSFRHIREKVSDKDFPALSVTKSGVVPQLETAAKTDDGDNRKLVRAGDFVINGRSDRNGSAGLSAKNGSVSLINLVLRPIDIDGQFTHFLLRSQPFQQEFYRNGKGIVADLWSTGYDEMRNILLATPPHEEQQRIAVFLGKETAKIDALIDEQRRLIELLKDKRQAVISHAVTKGLNPNVQMKDSRIDWVGDVPHHWTVVPVAYRYDVQLGKMLDTLKITGENLRPYLRVVDVQWDSINVDDLPLMDFDEDARCKFRLRAGDLLINEGGSYPGRTAIWSSDLECYYQKALHRLRPRAADTDHPRYFFYLMFWALHTGVFTAGGNEATIEHLPAEKLRRYRFAFPQYEEQSGIAEFLDEQTSQFNSLISAAQRAVDLFQERRSALISSAVTGKIDVRNYTPKEAA